MLAPLNPRAWSRDHAAHLLGRAGFGGSPDEIRAFHALGLDGAVERLLAARGDEPVAPAWTTEPAAASAAGDKAEAMRRERERVVELRGWWLRRMRAGRQPLREKMTLFWHGHFATSFTKVRSAWAMWRQNETLREHALGDFRALLRAISRDPAMIRWLDLQRSRAGAPNENFSRELMELFTLGVGNYREEDVKEAARAFTGHRVDPRTREFFFARRQHDFGEKQFLNGAGRFDGDGIIDVILRQPACARFVAGRLWEFFAYENPEPAVLDAVARTFRESDHQLAPLLRAMFCSAAFYSKCAARTHIKSPVEWLVQTCIALDVDLPQSPARDRALAQLGQLPFEPPNVRGWEGGRSWISSSTLVLRYNLAGYLLGVADPAARRLFPPRLRAPVAMARLAPPTLRRQPEAFADDLLLRLFGAAPPVALRERALAAIAEAGQPVSDAAVRVIFQRLMSTPDYQLS